MTESKNGLHVSDDLCRTFQTALRTLRPLGSDQT